MMPHCTRPRVRSTKRDVIKAFISSSELFFLRCTSYLRTRGGGQCSIVRTERFLTSLPGMGHHTFNCQVGEGARVLAIRTLYQITKCVLVQFAWVAGCSAPERHTATLWL